MSETQPELREALARAATVLICKGACLIPSMCAMCDARKQQAIKALSAQIEPILAQVSALQAEVERLQKVEGEREAAVAALRPFAAMAAQYDGYGDAYQPLTCRPSVAMLRVARSAVTETKEGSDAP